MFRRPAARPGSSMTEVLITLLVLAIALTSVVSLFPLAAITMGEALKGDRTTSSALTGDGFIRDFHRSVAEQGDSSTEPYYVALDPGRNLPPSEPSFPVVIDPVGSFAPVSKPNLYGDNGGTSVARVNLSTIATSTQAIRLFYQLDGLSFTEDGVPVANQAEMRELRYSWLYVVQRPVNRDKFTLTLTVVVFDKRKPLYAPPGSEAVYAARFTPGQTRVTGIPASAEIRRGGWVADATVGNDDAGQQVRHAKFYRVVSVTEEANGTYTLELHTPVARVDGRATGYNGTLVVDPRVADVFERPLLTGPAH